MKNDLFSKIQIPNKSKNNRKDNQNEKYSRNNKIIIPKIKTNLISNEKQEKEKLFQRSMANITLYKNKENKLLNNKIYLPINKKNNITKLEKQNENKDGLCNTDRTNNNKKENKDLKTLYNFYIKNNNKNNEKCKSINPLLLTFKKSSKKSIFEKHKNNNNNITEIENSTTDIDIENNSKLNSLSKHKSFQNFNKNIIFSKTKSTRNNKNEFNEKNSFKKLTQHNRIKTLEKNKLKDILDNFYTLTDFSGNKYFYNNKKMVSSLSTNKITTINNNTIYKKINKANIEKNELNNLDIIFEDYKKNNKESHHYLENTISAKNKMVKKKRVEVSLSNDIEKYNKKVSNKMLCRQFNIIFDKESQNDKIKNILYKTNSINNNKKLIDNNIQKINNTIILNNNSKRTKSIDFNNKKHIKNNTHYNSEIINQDKKNIFNGKIENYLLTKELGKGSCAVVKKATHKITKDKFAIKIYTKEFLLDPQKRSVVKNEINILKHLDNEFIMKLYEEIDTPDFLYLVLEYINGIPLIELLKYEINNCLPENRAKNLIIQIIKGIIYLHSKNICHRDIKLENILVMKNDVIKIIDFGFAVKCNKDSYQKLYCGTPSYMAPEILNKEKYIPYYSDIWSLGVLFYAMLFGRFPFEFNNDIINDNNESEIKSIKEFNLKFPDEIKIDDSLKNLFKKIFVIEPKQRIQLNEILNMLLDKN